MNISAAVKNRVAARTVHFSSISVYMGQGGSGAGSHGVAYTKVETEMKNQGRG
jgi:hypothetical protein